MHRRLGVFAVVLVFWLLSFVVLEGCEMGLLGAARGSSIQYWTVCLLGDVGIGRLNLHCRGACRKPKPESWLDTLIVLFNVAQTIP